jgi:hypothetical protein
MVETLEKGLLLFFNDNNPFSSVSTMSTIDLVFMYYILTCFIIFVQVLGAVSACLHVVPYKKICIWAAYEILDLSSLMDV